MADQIFPDWFTALQLDKIQLNLTLNVHCEITNFSFSFISIVILAFSYRNMTIHMYIFLQVWPRRRFFPSPSFSSLVVMTPPPSQSPTFFTTWPSIQMCCRRCKVKLTQSFQKMSAIVPEINLMADMNEWMQYKLFSCVLRPPFRTRSYWIFSTWTRFSMSLSACFRLPFV